MSGDRGVSERDVSGEPSIVEAMRILTPNLTEEEIAAVTAVVALTIEELADEQTPAVDDTPERWRSGIRPMRGDLSTARGAWGHSLR